MWLCRTMDSWRDHSSGTTPRNQWSILKTLDKAGQSRWLDKNQVRYFVSESFIYLKQMTVGIFFLYFWPMEDIFLITIYGLYFSHQHTYFKLFFFGGGPKEDRFLTTITTITVYISVINTHIFFMIFECFSLLSIKRKHAFMVEIHNTPR